MVLTQCKPDSWPLLTSGFWVARVQRQPCCGIYSKRGVLGWLLVARKTPEGCGGTGPIMESLFCFVLFCLVCLSTLVYAVSQTSI